MFMLFLCGLRQEGFGVIVWQPAGDAFELDLVVFGKILSSDGPDGWMDD